MKTKHNSFKLLSALLCVALILCAVPMTAFAATEVAINETNFPDAKFREYVSSNFDTNENGSLSETEIASVTDIYAHNLGIKNLKGIEFFTKLTELTCTKNQLASLDVSRNTALTELYCSRNQITSLNLGNNTVLESLYCQDNRLTSLNLANNTALKLVECYNNRLTSLDVSNNKHLGYLDCDNNLLTSLDVSRNTALTELYCSRNRIASLNLGNNTTLESLYCYYNQLTSLDVSKNKALKYLSCTHNRLTSLDVSSNTALTKLYCSNNRLTSLDISNNKALEYYEINNESYTINLSRSRKLDLSTLPGNLDLSKASNWTGGTVSGNILTVNEGAKFASYSYDIGNGLIETFKIYFADAHAGDRLTVTFSFAKDNNVGIPNYQFDCYYNSSRLEYKSYDNHWCMEPFLGNHPSQYIILMNATDWPGPAVTAGEKIITLNFDITDDLSSAEPFFEIYDFVMTDNDDEWLDISSINCSMKIYNQTVKPDYEQGDVNKDGVISINDATEIQKYIAGMTSFDDTQKQLADVNGDLSIDIADATAIQKLIAG